MVVKIMDWEVMISWIPPFSLYSGLLRERVFAAKRCRAQCSKKVMD
jgi:hypothetical protein